MNEILEATTLPLSHMCTHTFFQMICKCFAPVAAYNEVGMISSCQR